MNGKTILKRIAFSLCMNYKNHKQMYNRLFEKIREKIDNNKKS